MKKFLALIALAALTGVATSGQPLPVPMRAVVYDNIASTAFVIDNRAVAIRQSTLHTFCATGTGTWSVQIQYSNTSPSAGWTNFSDTGSLVSNSSANCVGIGNGYHAYIRFSISGSVTVSYRGIRDLYLYQPTSGATPAPADATYVTNTPNGTLTQEQALSLLSTGIAVITTGTGQVTTVAAPAGTILGTTDTQTISNKTLGSGNNVGNGGSLGRTGTGTIDANVLMGVPLGPLTGIIKLNSGVPAVAIAGDFPTLNQNTTGNAATSSALAADPANCSAGNLPRGIDAAGVGQGCAPVNLTTESTGPAPTATALAANPANCSAGNIPRGIDASGVAEGCAPLNLATESTGAAPTASALAANPANCSAGNLPQGITAAGVAENCTPTAQKFFGTAAPGSVSGNLPGDEYTDTTNHNAYRCGAPAATAAPACTTVSASSWILLNDGGGSGSVPSGTGFYSINSGVAGPTRTNTSGAGVIVTNGDGVGGNPTFTADTAVMLSRATDQAGTDKICSSTTGNATYVCALTPTLTAYTTGQCVPLITDFSSVTTATLNIDTLGAKSILGPTGAALVAGNVTTGVPVVVCYDGTHFVISGVAGSPAGYDPSLSTPSYTFEEFSNFPDSTHVGTAWTVSYFPNAATLTRGAPEANHFGVARITTGTVSGDQGYITEYGTYSFNGTLLSDDLVSSAGWFREMLVRYASTASVKYRLGYVDGLANGNNWPASPNGIYIEFLAGTDTNWMCVTNHAGTSTRTSIGVAPATNTWQKLKISSDVVGTVKCSVGTTTVSVTTNLPATSVQQFPMYYVETATGSSKTLDIDYDNFKYSPTR